MLPTLRMPLSGLACVPGEASVSPYPSTTRPLVSFSNSSCVSTASGADPLIHALMESIPYFFTPGNPLRLKYICGTPGKIVGLYRLMALSVSSTSNLALSINDAPTATPTLSTVVNPYTCENGTTHRNRSSPSFASGIQCRICRVFATMLRWDNATPLAIPVVPPV